MNFITASSSSPSQLKTSSEIENRTAEVEHKKSTPNKPIARVRPKTENKIEQDARALNEHLGKPIPSPSVHQPVPFRPYSKDFSLKQKPVQSRPTSLEDQRLVTCASLYSNLAQPPYPVSYTPMFNYIDGKYYLQPFTNVMPSVNPLMVSPPTGSVAPFPPVLPFITSAMPSSTSLANTMSLIGPTGRKVNGAVAATTEEPPTRQLSAKDKLSSVAWLASSHRKELKFSDASSAGDDQGSDNSVNSDILNEDDHVDICG